MNTSIRAPGYDIFKLIVAVLLLILFLLLLWRGNLQAPIPTITPLPPTEITSVTSSAVTVIAPTQASATIIPSVLATSSRTLTPIPSPTTISTSSPTSIPASLPTDAHQIEPTPSPVSTSIPSRLPTLTPGLEPTPTVISGTLSNTAACDAVNSRSRLQVGGEATILRRLNFRSSPGIQQNWLLTNRPGTQVEVIGGPTCLPHYAGAYVWWEIKLPDGRTGWSAEASQLGSFYFMEPVP